MFSNKKLKITLLITVFVMFSLVCGAAWAKRPGFTTCPAGLTGTWIGGAGNDIHWLSTQTSDSLDPTKGEMIMNWTYIKPSFIGGSSSGVTLSPGHGVWQLNDDGNYDYTWYAYAIDNDPNNTTTYGTIVATIRVSGVVMLVDFNDIDAPNCDTAAIYYHFDMADGEFLPFDPNAPVFSTLTSGWGAGEMRVPLNVIQDVPPLQ